MTGAAESAAALHKLLDDLGVTWEVSLPLPDAPREPYRTLRPREGAAPVQPTDAAVIDHLTAMGRDPFALTEADRAHVAAALVERHRRGLRGAALYASAASAWRDRVVERMRGGRAAAPVSAVWAARKAALGYPVTSSVASGQLVRAVAAALPRVRKIR